MDIEPLFTDTQAREESSRCLQCLDAPCTAACPAGIVIPRFVRMIQSGNLTGAAEVVRASNPLAWSCGLACPDEQYCGAACTRAAIDRPIEIRKLHRFATERGEGAGLRAAPSPGSATTPPARRDPPRVAVLGAGPAGLACAFELLRRGVQVTVFDRRHRPGGVLDRTIPAYRFPPEATERDAAWTLGGGNALKAAPRLELKLGGAIEDGAAIEDTGAPGGQLDTLGRHFDAVFVATGVSPTPSGIPGAEIDGVVTADAFLEDCRSRLYKVPIGESVAVIGGGNVAVDAALAVMRCAEVQGRTPPPVHLLYRRTRNEMPAWQREVREAEKLGVVLHFLVVPIAFEEQSGRLRGISLQRARLGNKDESGRATPVPIPESAFVLECDQVILATESRPTAAAMRDLPRSANGFLAADSESGNVRDNVFAGGDVAGGDGTIVAAVRDGRRGARGIVAYLGLEGA